MIIIGAGVSGSYLASLLDQEGSEYEAYDFAEVRGCTCAWGTHYSLLKERLSKVGLNADDYILSRCRTLIFGGVRIKLLNSVMIDKPKLIDDLLPSSKVVRKKVSLHQLQEDIVVNATAEPAVLDKQLLTVQHKVLAGNLEPNTSYIHVDRRYVGYAWCFPLDDEGKYFHLGAGCLDERPTPLLEGMKERYKIIVKQELCSCDRAINLVSPSKISADASKFISIGEAGGYVFPLTGEGIIPSMDSAEILLQSMQACGSREEVALSYKAKSLAYFRKEKYGEAHNILERMKKGKAFSWASAVKHLFVRSKNRSMPVLSFATKLKVLVSLGRPTC